MKGGARRRVWAMMHTGAGRFTVGQAVVVFLILASFVLLALETERALDPQLRRVAHRLDMAIPVAFGLEFTMRLWARGASPLYRGWAGMWKFLFRPVVLLDFLAFAPELFVMLLFPGLSGASWVRLLRVFRLLKLFAMFRPFREIAAAVRDAGRQLGATFAVAGMLLFVAASLLYAIEGRAQPEAFGSVPRALWWAVATLTTVGYGDVYPVTALGKLVAGCVAVIGVGLVALPAGILANAFAERLRK